MTLVKCKMYPKSGQDSAREQRPKPADWLILSRTQTGLSPKSKDADRRFWPSPLRERTKSPGWGSKIVGNLLTCNRSMKRTKVYQSICWLCSGLPARSPSKVPRFADGLKKGEVPLLEVQKSEMEGDTHIAGFCSLQPRMRTSSLDLAIRNGTKTKL